MIPSDNKIKLEKNKIKIFVVLNPFGINNKSLDKRFIIDKNLTIRIKNENNKAADETTKPENKIILRGTNEKEIKPSNPKKKESKNLNFSSPAFLAGISYSIPV